MKSEKLIEKKSLQEQKQKKIMNCEDLDIPLYADDKFNEEIKLRTNEEKKKLQNEKSKENKELKAVEKAEKNKRLIPLFNINGYLLSTCAVMIILGVTSFFMNNLLNAMYSLIAMLITIYIGRRLTFKAKDIDEIGNVLIWNITQTLNDFIEYKLNYDIKESYRKIIKISSVSSILSLLLLNSNNIIYGMSLVLLTIGYLMAIAYRDFSSITCNLNKLIICSLIGIFIKTILSYFILHIFTIDFFNVIAIDMFVIIKLLEGINIEEPVE